MTSLSRMLAHVGVRELYLAYILHDGAASTQLRIVTDRRATRKINRLARATKSGIAHAVKSFNMFGLAMKFTLRASLGSVTLIGYTRTQRSC